MSATAPGKPPSVLRNTLLLVGAQLAGTPLAILINAIMGRHLGAGAFGYAYLAWTLIGFGFLLVDWGQSGVLPAAVARDRSRAGLLLGTSMVWKLLAGVVITAVLSGVCLVLGYPGTFQGVLGLVALQALFVAISSTIQDVVRGFERTDLDAFGKFGLQLLTALFVIPTLLLGGQLKAVLAAQAAASGVILLLVWLASRRIEIGKVSFRQDELKPLLKSGGSFLAFSFALTLQGNVDMVFLSKLAPPEVVGWFAAARRLTGILVVPALALIGALYPTLARLYSQDQEQYRATARNALRGTASLAVPVALCCALYRDVGVSLFSKKSFGPAGQNMLILSALLLLVYISMPLGSAILAAGRERRFAWAQTLCVVVSVALDPLLIPYFQTRYGNGGLGVSISAVVSEVLMVASAIYIVPAGVVDRSLAIALLRASAAGAVMAAVAWLLRSFTPYLAGPLAFLAYCISLWLVGGVDKQQLASAWQGLRRKAQRQA